MNLMSRVKESRVLEKKRNVALIRRSYLYRDRARHIPSTRLPHSSC